MFYKLYGDIFRDLGERFIPDQEPQHELINKRIILTGAAGGIASLA